MDAKEKLLKPTIWNIENPEAIQLQMLALLDNEISGDEKLEIEKKIASDFGLQIEWNSLQKVKLLAETLIFPVAPQALLRCVCHPHHPLALALLLQTRCSSFSSLAEPGGSEINHHTQI